MSYAIKLLFFLGSCILAFVAGRLTSSLSYHWSQVDGPNQAVIVSPNDSTTQVNGLVQGVYHFELAVTDPQGATGRDTMMVTVLPGVLPIKLVYFKAYPLADVNMIKWKTSEEINIKEFILESSTDGVHFYGLYHTFAIGATPTSPSEYDYEHKFPGREQYYRLKSIETSGTYTYSDVVKVTRSISTSIWSNNPVTSTLNVTINVDNATTANFYIYDATGRRMAFYTYNLSPGKNSFSYHTGQYASGLYIIKVDVGGIISTKKFVKQ